MSVDLGDKLKPCPHCGGNAELIIPWDSSLPYVMCVNDYCTGPKPTPDQAITAWNRRTTEGDAS